MSALFAYPGKITEKGEEEHDLQSDKRDHDHPLKGGPYPKPVQGMPLPLRASPAIVLEERSERMYQKNDRRISTEELKNTDFRKRAQDFLKNGNSKDLNQSRYKNSCENKKKTTCSM